MTTVKNDYSNHSGFHPFRLAVIQALSGFFFLASIIPLIGPAFLGFMMGATNQRYKKLYHIKTRDHFLAMIIGFFLLHGFIALLTANPTNLFWFILISSIAINFILASIAFWIGATKYADKES